MSRIKIMRMSGRRFGWKFGNSQIAVKEYFDKEQPLQMKVALLEGEKEEYERFLAGNSNPHGHTEDNYKKTLKSLDRFYRRLRAVESRTWTPMASFIIDRPSEDEVNLETFVKGHILARIEESNGMEKSQERQAEGSQAIRAEAASV